MVHTNTLVVTLKAVIPTKSVVLIGRVDDNLCEYDVVVSPLLDKQPDPWDLAWNRCVLINHTETVIYLYRWQAFHELNHSLEHQNHQ